MLTPRNARRGLLAAVAVLVATAATVATPSAPPSLDAGGWLSADAAARALADPAFMTGAEDGRLTAPGDYLMAQRGEVGLAAYERALDDAERLRARTRVTDPALAASPWTNLGPTNIGGRALDLAVDPKLDDTVYVATASGGVWKSTDAGATYAPAWPDRLTQSVGALAVGSDGVLWAGTGEAGPGGGSVTYGGTGVYRSTDRGRTWTYVGLRRSGAIGRIVVDPRNPKRVYVAATGDLYAPGGDRGLYRTDDAGRSWRLVLKGANAFTGAVDVAIDPKNPSRMFAAMWERRRVATHRAYGGKGSALFKSLDGGRTWLRAAEVTDGEGPASTGRIGVAIAPSDPDRVYAVVVTTSGRHSGLWRSDDFGGEWSPTGDSTVRANASSYGWWFGRVYVDPLLADRVFVMGVELVESIDGGATFVAQSSTLAGVATGANAALVHADQHALAWSARQPGLVYAANDGGVYRSRGNGVAGTFLAAVSAGWTQHYSVGVSMANPSRVVSGLQDNLCLRNYVVGPVARPDTWTKYGLCGDGLQTLINHEDENVVYGCSQYGSCSRSIDGGFAFQALGRTESDRRGWWTPLQLDPSDADVVYYAGNVLNRSTDGGATFTAISPDLSSDPDQLDPESGYHNYGVATTVAIARSEPKTIFVGTDEGFLWLTRDLGRSWTRLTAGNLPRSWVTRVAIDPSNAKTMYAAFSGYRSGSAKALVMRTADGGRTWKDISRGLPSAPVNEVEVLGSSTLAVGTDVGVYLTKNLGASWQAVGKGMPSVPVMDLHWHPATRQLTAATFGRGVMRVVIPR